MSRMMLIMVKYLGFFCMDSEVMRELVLAYENDLHVSSRSAWQRHTRTFSIYIALHFAMREDMCASGASMQPTLTSGALT